MQDPVREVREVVKALIEAPNAMAQRKTLRTFFAPDASFDHPLCAVASGPNSRDGGLLPIYQWLRCMFTSTIVVDNVAFDKDSNKIYIAIFLADVFEPTDQKFGSLSIRVEVQGTAFDIRFLDATQTLTPSVWPLNRVYAPACRLIVVLGLQRGADGRFYIKRQEDYYEPQVMPGMIIPGLSRVILLAKLFAGFNCWILASLIGHTLGWWNPNRVPTAQRKAAAKVSN